MRRRVERLREFRDLFRSMFGERSSDAMDIANRVVVTCRALGGEPFIEWSWNPRRRFVSVECVLPKNLARVGLATGFRVKGARFASAAGAGKISLSLATVDSLGYEVRHGEVEIPFRLSDVVRFSARKVGSLSLSKELDRVYLGTGAEEGELERFGVRLKPMESERSLWIELEV